MGAKSKEKKKLGVAIVETFVDQSATGSLHSDGFLSHHHFA